MVRRIPYNEIPKSIRYNLQVKSRQRSINGKAIRMPPSDKLIKVSGNTWGFATEEALEDFIWENITIIFNLTPLERQRSINGERCDIIAVSNDGQLVIIELKNSQDRGVVQQLTRYYANVILTKPFEIDYKKTIRLVAITPNFHKHNLIDREYNKLIIDFIEFQITEKKDGDLYLLLTNIDNGQIWKIPIAYQPEQVYKLQDYLPPVPSVLTKIINSCTSEQKEIILQVRERILCFHERIQEIKGANFVKYGRGENKICAEIRPNNSSSQMKTLGFNQPILYLYLPIPNRTTPRSLENPNDLRRHPLGRMQLSSAHTTKDWKTFASSGVASHIPPGKRNSISGSYIMDSFAPFMASKADCDLNTLIDLALDSWLDRL